MNRARPILDRDGEPVTQERYELLRAEQIRARIRRAERRFCILPLDQLRGLPRITNRTGSGVYFLWRRSRLVYVGRSIDIARRLQQHRFAFVTFSFATWIPVCEERHRPYEAEYIESYGPPLNHRLEPIVWA